MNIKYTKEILEPIVKKLQISSVLTVIVRNRYFKDEIMSKLIDESMKHIEWCLDQLKGQEIKPYLLPEIRKTMINYAFAAMTESQVKDEVYQEIK
jgi:hypothetical protein